MHPDQPLPDDKQELLPPSGNSEVLNPTNGKVDIAAQRRKWAATYRSSFLNDRAWKDRWNQPIVNRHPTDGEKRYFQALATERRQKEEDRKWGKH